MTCLVFVGTVTRPVPHFEASGGKGIHVLRLDETNGELTELSVTDAVNPHYLGFDALSLTLYAISEVLEWPEGQVTSYRFDPASAGLTLQDQRSTLGHLACFTSLTNDNRHLLVANYTMPPPGIAAGCSFAALPVSDGTIGEATACIVHEGKGSNVERQERSHPHCIIQLPDGRLACTDLGMDEVRIYTFDDRSGLIAEAPTNIIKMPPGVGPRHLCHTKSGDRIFVVNEMAATLSVLQKEGKEYFLHNSLPLLPAGMSAPDRYAAAIALSSDESSVYVSNRRPDCISLLKADPATGKLALHGCWPSGGKTPRSMALSPNGRFLIIGNQDSDGLSVFGIEPSGTLNWVQTHPITAPMCITMAEVKHNVKSE